MIRHRVAALAAAYALAAAPAAATDVFLATSPAGTLFNSIATATAKVVSDAGQVRVVVNPYGGGTQWLPLLDRGEVSMGLASAIDTDDAGRGIGSYEGKPHPNIRVGGALAPLLFAMFVRGDSPAKTVADLKGLRIPTEFPTALVVVRAMSAYLASSGLGFADFKPVPTSGLAQNVNDFKAGRVDIGTLPIGAGGLAEINTTVRGGIRYVTMDDAPAAQARMRAVIPHVYTTVIRPGPAFVGIPEPITAMAYDTYMLFGKDVPETAVYAVVKAMHEGKDALAATFPWFRAFDPAAMAKAFSIAYHPGAVKYYTEKGMWLPRRN
ncbi:MAG: TAXI family TRAP transporter solute-binding subunit [Alphaproteobacteria bacterium]|nr:TAXI family TRAP transporter solute-binding subunit [Alphaproteobacteria bacterium]